MEDSFNCLGRNIWTEDFLFLERLFLWPSNKIWTLPRPYFVISFVAGWSALSKLHICRHKEVKRFHFIFNCSTYNFDVKDSFILMRLPGWYCKMDNIFMLFRKILRKTCYHLTIFFGEGKFWLPFKNEVADEKSEHCSMTRKFLCKSSSATLFLEGSQLNYCS